MKRLGKIIGISIAIAILAIAIVGSIVFSADNIVRENGIWSDATDVLSRKAAEQAGREARAPYINTEQGNMLVFFFCLGGVAAGSIIGYSWRSLLTEKVKRK
jgi:hypothetical protein